MVLAGVARGLAGFGFGLIVMPIGALLFMPQTLVPVLALVDIPAAILLLGGAWRLANQREVTPLILAAVICLPVGVWLLLVVSAEALTVFVHVLVLCVGIALLRGLKWQGPPSMARTLVLGGMAGMLHSSVSLPGPPIILGWVAANLPGAVLRANIIVFFLAIDIISLPILWTAGLFTQPVLILAASMTPVYLGGVLLGRALFPYISEKLFRRAVLGLVILGALSGLIVSLDRFWP